jgi:hypothetical protein
LPRTCGFSKQGLVDMTPCLLERPGSLLRIIRGYENRIRQLALRADYKLARILPTELPTKKL